MNKNRWISDLHWVRKGQQTRSQKTQSALLDASEKLFGEQGVDSTSVADVAKEAGCSVGAVYHHFKDKQTLLYATVNRMVEESIATAELALDQDRWQGATLVDMLQGFLEFSLTQGRVHAKFKSALTEVARQDETVAREMQRLSESQKLTTLLLTRQSEIGHSDPKLGIAMVLDQFSGLLRSRLGDSPYKMHTHQESDQVFIREACDAACAYLKVSTLK